MAKILLVEDSASLGYILKEYLELHEFSVTWAKDGQEGWRFFSRSPPDLCLLDVMMPQKDGFMLAQELKAACPHMPIIFLTAKSLKIDKLKGFKLGADDYLVKPVEEEELLARIRAVLKRSHAVVTSEKNAGNRIFTIGQYTFDTEKRVLNYWGQHITITERETQILKLLCQHKNQILKRSEALVKIWGGNDYFNRRAMDVHISKLRKHLSLDKNVKIVNLHNQGFMLTDQGETSSRG